MPRVGEMSNPACGGVAVMQLAPIIGRGNPNKLYAATFIGIDPGATGGVAFISPLSTSGKPIVTAHKMPDTEADLWDLVVKNASSVQFAAVEQLTGFVGEAVPSHTMFKLGTNYGSARMALTAARIPYELATPQKWQKALGIPKRDKKETRTEWKNRLKAFAQRLFPDVVVTLSTADAILIAEFARRLKGGLL